MEEWLQQFTPQQIMDALSTASKWLVITVAITIVARRLLMALEAKWSKR